MNQKNQPSSSAGRIISISGLSVFVLGSMLWKIVSAYIQGGSDAPSIGVLIAAILILGGGILFALWLIISKGKLFLPSNEEVRDL